MRKITFISILIVSFLFGYSLKRVEGYSMLPTLKPHTIVLCLPIRYDVGDIVAYRKGNISIVHRIIMMNETHILTQGDNNPVPDEPVTRDKVICKVVLHP